MWFTVALIGSLVFLLFILSREGEHSQSAAKIIEVVDVDNDDTQTIHRKVRSSGSWK